MFLGLLRGQMWFSLSLCLGSAAEQPKCEMFPLDGDARRGFPQPGFIWLWLSPALASHPGIWPGAKK